MPAPPYDHDVDNVMWQVKDALSHQRPYAVAVQMPDGKWFLSVHGAMDPHQCADLSGRLSILQHIVNEDAVAGEFGEPEDAGGPEGEEADSA